MLDREIRWLTDEKYGGDSDAEGIVDDIKRLEAGEPLAYVIGFVDFLGARIDLSKRPLIPRPETEFWVGEAIKRLKDQGGVKCLDLFSGSGCIGLSVLRHILGASMIFAEKDSRFIRQIKKNLELNNIDENRYQIIESDVFSRIDGEYDFIFANPPYGSESRRANVQESVLKYEPQEAIFAPDDGLFFIKELIQKAPDFLKWRGILYLEFDDPQYEDIKELLQESAFSQTEILRDQFGKWRLARLTR